MKKVKILNDWVCPGKIVCIGRNYVGHINELQNEMPDEPVVFCKPNSTISESLLCEHGGETLHFETEICFAVANGEYSAVGVGLDLTKRATQSKLKKKGLPWERAKAFDGAAVFSDFVELPEQPSQLGLELKINGNLVQKGAVDRMLYPPEHLLHAVKQFLSLNDHDIVMTGTPKGAGAIYRNDVFHAQVTCGNRVLIHKEWVAK
ncbi:MAG: 2-keto-4-pentenoate hydratase [Acidobacteria bacterium]|nr:MAG: 2-keto-4-pentenoate hydratase [Acidobacteriota bacterium]